MHINNLLLKDLMIENNNCSTISINDYKDIEMAIATLEEKMTAEQCYMFHCLKGSAVKSLVDSHFLYNYYGNDFYLQFGITEGLWDRLLDVDDEYEMFNDIGADGVSYLQTFNKLIDLCEMEAVIKNDRVVYDMTYTTSAKFLMFELIRRHNVMYANNLHYPDEVIDEIDELF